MYVRLNNYLTPHTTPFWTSLLTSTYQQPWNTYTIINYHHHQNHTLSDLSKVRPIFPPRRLVAKPETEAFGISRRCNPRYPTQRPQGASVLASPSRQRRNIKYWRWKLNPEKGEMADNCQPPHCSAKIWKY